MRGAVLISTAFMTYRSFEHRVSKWYYPDKLTFYKNSHYTAEFDIAEVHRALKLIPPDVPLSASEVLVPHLAFRDSIYQFPVVKNAEFIMILRHSQSYPLNAEELIRESERLLHDKSWLLLYNKNNTLIFRKAPSGHSKSNNSSAD